MKKLKATIWWAVNHFTGRMVRVEKSAHNAVEAKEDFPFTGRDYSVTPCLVIPLTRREARWIKAKDGRTGEDVLNRMREDAWERGYKAANIVSAGQNIFLEDWQKLRDWFANPKRKPANVAFTAGAARDAATAWEAGQARGQA